MITIVANVFATYITEFVAAIEHDAFADDVVIIDDVVVVAAETVFAAFIAFTDGSCNSKPKKEFSRYLRRSDFQKYDGSRDGGWSMMLFSFSSCNDQLCENQIFACL